MKYSRITELSTVAVGIAVPLCLNPYNNSPYEPEKAYIFLALLLVSGAAWFFHIKAYALRQINALISLPLSSIARNSVVTLVANPLAGVSLVYLLATVVSTITSVDLLLSLWGNGPNPQSLVMVSAAIGFFLLAANALDAKGAERVAYSIVVGSVPIALYGLVQFLGLDPLPWVTDSISPVLSTLGRSNYLGAYLSTVVPIALVFLIAQRKAPRRGVAILALIIVCQYLTAARAAWMAMTIGSAFSIGLSAWMLRSVRLSVATIIFLGIAFAVAPAMDNIVRAHPAVAEWTWTYLASLTGRNPDNYQRLRPRIPLEWYGERAEERRDASWRARLLIWRSSASLFWQRPITGWGPATFEHIFPLVCPPELARFQSKETELSDPDNLALNHLVSSGLLGFSAFAALVVASTRVFIFGQTRLISNLTGKARRHIQEAVLLAGIGGSLIAYLIHSSFNQVTLTHSVLFWVELALLVVLCRTNRLSSNTMERGTGNA